MIFYICLCLAVFNPHFESSINIILAAINFLPPHTLQWCLYKLTNHQENVRFHKRLKKTKACNCFGIIVVIYAKMFRPYPLYHIKYTIPLYHFLKCVFILILG